MSKNAATPSLRTMTTLSTTATTQLRGNDRSSETYRNAATPVPMLPSDFFGIAPTSRKSLSDVLQEAIDLLDEIDFPDDDDADADDKCNLSSAAAGKNAQQ